MFHILTIQSVLSYKAFHHPAHMSVPDLPCSLSNTPPYPKWWSGRVIQVVQLRYLNKTTILSFYYFTNRLGIAPHHHITKPIFFQKSRIFLRLNRRKIRWFFLRETSPGPMGRNGSFAGARRAALESSMCRRSTHGRRAIEALKLMS